jgi:hypothetical protein
MVLSSTKKIESDDDTLVSESELSENSLQLAIKTAEGEMAESIARDEDKLQTK